MTLTVAANAALRRFRIAMAEIDASRDDALQAERQARSRIRVGALTVAMMELVPQVVARIIAQPMTSRCRFPKAPSTIRRNACSAASSTWWWAVSG